MIKDHNKISATLCQNILFSQEIIYEKNMVLNSSFVGVFIH